MVYNKNLQCIEKILRWTNKMKAVFTEFNINSLEDFENSETCQLAVTQLITNIHELYKKIDEETLEKLPLLSELRRRIKTARNIASHEYEELDLDTIYRTVRRLIKTTLIEELEGAINDFGENEECV